MKYIIFSICLFFFSFGCSPYEAARLTGIGVRPFRTKGEIYSQDFKKNIIDCYYQVEEIIEKLEAIPYRGSSNKGFLVSFGYNKIFPSASHSTEVIIFFNWLDANITKVKVSSLNYTLSKFVSEKIFQELAKN
ncbi:MAG: hypothetical protein K9M01_03075 [Candidatus Omnitrophica bacterium]|nr:hypothetical protein [Candidatus Omnitrophota bacterium]